MTSADGTTPAARYVAALAAGMTEAEAYAATYPTPALHSPKR